MFDGKEKQALQAEVARLQQWVTYLKGTEPIQVAAQTQQAKDYLEALQRYSAGEQARFQAEIADSQQRLRAVQSALAMAEAQIVRTAETQLLQEVGIYQYRHPLTDAVAYRAALDALNNQIKTIARSNTAVTAVTSWTVNGSPRDGLKMVRDFSKLMLRAYNAEADNCVRTLKPFTLASVIERLSKTRETIAKLGMTMQIRISDEYHALRVRELELTSDYLARKEEEKERIREERERQREEAVARREYERELERLAKEHNHYASALERLRASGDEAKAAEIEAKLGHIRDALAGLEARQANVRAGYVYVISNYGSFGERMVKIGLTRRLEPMDRVNELGDASVPFRFDVHALIFSDDAVGLEARLHQELDLQKVNLVNPRREFFYATPSEVREVLERIGGQYLLEYSEVSEAVEWRASRRGRSPVLSVITGDVPTSGAGDAFATEATVPASAPSQPSVPVVNWPVAQ